MKKILIFSMLVLLLSGCNGVKKQDEVNVITKDLKLTTGDYELDGVLTLPNKEGTYPIVILVHGSGPNDMNETLMGTKLFKDLANQLANQGIATYRYDKRTFTYQSQLASDSSLTTQEEVIDDVLSAIDLVGNQDNVDKDNIYIAGHSLGGYLIPKINEQTSVPKGYIMLAANARPLHELIPEQINYLVKLDKEVSSDEQSYVEEVNKQMETIKNIDKANDLEPIFGAYKAYWKDLNDYDALKIAKNIDKPVLVLQGEKDYQVTMTDYDLWKTVGNDEWTYITYSELNHAFTQGGNPPSPDDYSTSTDLDTSVAKDIAQWIKE